MFAELLAILRGMMGHMADSAGIPLVLCAVLLAIYLIHRRAS
jgi:hypothetical protein